jgi:hypothetical protein
MSTDGILEYQGTKRVLFRGDTSNIVFDTRTTSLGIGVTGSNNPSSNLYITGNAYVSSNLAIGGVMTMGVVNVAARHNLQAVTDMGNVTTHTVEFTNPTTSIVASGNVEVAKELTVTGNATISSNLTVSGQVTRAYNPGEIIEELNSICDGSTVVVQSGSYTMANIVAYLTGTLTHQVITGSTINYTPPPGTKRVYYRFWFKWDAYRNSARSHFQFQIDNVVVTPSKNSIGSASSSDHQAAFPVSVEYTIDCNAASTNAANGKFTSWTSPKELECTFRDYDANNKCLVHVNEWTDGTGSDSIQKPHLTIRAIA